jgi:predicted nucleotidyltransferase
MNLDIIENLRYANSKFPQAEFIVFGSFARGTNKPSSDIDLCVIFPELDDDPFEISYKVRKEIHKHLDLPLDVIVVDKTTYDRRKLLNWAIEHTISVEGVQI